MYEWMSSAHELADAMHLTSEIYKLTTVMYSLNLIIVNLTSADLQFETVMIWPF